MARRIPAMGSDEREGDSGRLGMRVVFLLLTMAALVPFAPMLFRGEVPILRDHADYFVPLRWYTSALLKQGFIPHWNPLNGLGEPWLANPQTGVLYPPSWILLIVPFAAGYVLWLVFHLALLGCGVAALARRWGAGPMHALAAGVVGMLCGPTLSMIDVSNNLATVAWLPWIAVAGLRNRSSYGDGLIGGALLALAFLAGEPLLAAVGALLFVLLVAGSPGWSVKVTVATVAAIGASAPQLVPFVLSLSGTDRTGGLGLDAFRNSLSLRDLFGTIVPAREAAGFAERQQFVVSTWMSATASVLAICGWSHLTRERAAGAFRILLLCLALVFFASAGGIHPIADVFESAGLDFARHPSRFLVPAVVLLAAGVAAGFQRMRARRSRVIAGAVILIAGGALVFLPRNLISPTLLALDLILLAALLIVSRWRGAEGLIAAAALAPLLIAAGWFAFASGRFESLIPRTPDPVPGTRLASVPDEQTGSAGLAGRVRSSAGYLNLLNGRAKADSPAPIAPQGVLLYLSAALDGRDPILLSSASVSLLHAPGNVDGLEPAGVEGWWRVRALPLVSGWNGVERVADDDEALGTVLRRAQPGSIFAAGNALPVVNASERAPARLEVAPAPAGWQISVEAPGPRVVMITERADRGWSARVNGGSVPWATVNGVFRAVRVPAGRSTVEWNYRTPGWIEGWIVFAATTLALLFGWMLQRRRSRIQDSSRSATF